MLEMNAMQLPTRRDVLAAGTAAVLAGRGARAAETQATPAVRTITRGPKFHWFGYYDKLQFDPTGRYVLAMEVDFEHRTPRANDEIRVGMIDLADGDRWIELGRSRAWGWQQGCMLQWLPGPKSTVVWNDRQDGRFVCHILDVKTGKRRTIAHAIYTLSPDGLTAVSADFARIQAMRPGYGYAGPADAYAKEAAPAKSGVFRVDMTTGKSELIISLADIVKLDPSTVRKDAVKHWVNHLLFAPDGKRVIFLHRYKASGRGGLPTRMITIGPDGSDPYMLEPGGHMSHFIWRDATHILGWTRPRGKGNGFWLMTDRTQEARQIGKGVMPQNGHVTYLAGNKWIMNDTYPQGRQRKQHLYLYNIAANRSVTLGRFHLPPEYRGEWRCDLHPRSSADGKLVTFDSPHTGAGRQVHLIDVGGITKQ